jgi:zinc protease
MRKENYLTQRREVAKSQRVNLIKIFALRRLCVFALILFISALLTFAQTETPPVPSAPRSAKIPAVVEKKLANGLTVTTVERKNVPLVTVELLVKTGASGEAAEKAGLANMTASMLTKGTKTKTATQIAEAVEFLGGSISAGAGWNNSVVTITVTSDKLDAAMAILTDVVLNPKFDQSELDLLKSQTLDGLAYNLKQPGFLANYVASKYSFDEHPAGGTPETIKTISVADITQFKKQNYIPEDSVLIFTGDVANVRANALAQKFFGRWQNTNKEKIAVLEDSLPPPNVDYSAKQATAELGLLTRILVVDLPNSGQASVNYATFISKGRSDQNSEDKTISSAIFYPALVLNSVLGGGYSSRLNQEIRIKRGLSYGAGSNFAWRFNTSNFSTATQTKNESAAEVAELVLAEIKKLSEANIAAAELAPRKLVLTGDFGRDLETTNGLASTIAALYTYDLPLSDLNSHLQNVNSVSDVQIKNFAKDYLKDGELIIVGDYNVFKDDLAKRFPNVKIEVIKADELDLSKENLRK